MPGRPEKELDRLNPAATRIAGLLRTLRHAAGTPTYRAMEKTAHYSSAALSLAANGKKVPTWECTKAYLKACGITGDDEIARWRRRWLSAYDQERGHGSTSISFDHDPPEIDVLINAMGVLPTLPQPNLETDLSEITDVEEFRGALNQLREAYGLSLRDIERKSMGIAMPSTGDGLTAPGINTTRLARAVIHDMLQGKSPLTARNVNIYLSSCGLAQDQLGQWLTVFYRIRREEQQVSAAKQALSQDEQPISAAVQALRTLTANEAPPTPAMPDDKTPTADVPLQRQPDEKRPMLHRGQHRRPKIFRLFRHLRGLD